MDPFTAVGLADAIISLVETAAKTVKRVNEFIKNRKDIPDAYKHISNELPAVIKTLENIRLDDKKPSWTADEGSLRALVILVNGLKSQVMLLESIFDDITPSTNDTKWELSRKAMRSMRRDSDVAKIYSQIHGYMETLMFSQVSSLTTILSKLQPVVFESSFSPLYEVPYHRRASPFFGREDVLAELTQKLDAPSPRPSTVVLYGMGGQGKTQVALMFCERAFLTDQKGNRRYHAIFWVDASSREAARKSFVNIYSVVKTPQSVLEAEEDCIAFVKSYLKQLSVPWLIVFDNFDNPGDFWEAREYMPFGNHGAVLITSRHADSQKYRSTKNGVIKLPGLAEEDAVDLLITGSQQDETQDTWDEASIIVKELGYHPLAIAQAADYISEHPPLSTFISRYRKKKDDVLRWSATIFEQRQRSGVDEEGDSVSVFTSFELSVSYLPTKDNFQDRVREFLTLCGFFHYENLSEDLFKMASLSDDWVQLFMLKGAWDGDRFVSLLTRLKKMSIIQAYYAKDGVFSLHPLMSEWLKWGVREASAAEHRKASVLSVAKMLKGYLTSAVATKMPDYDGISYEKKQDLLLHILACQAGIEQFWIHGSISVELEEIEEFFAQFLFQMGEFQKAVDLQEPVLAQKEKRLGVDAVALVPSRTRLANMCQRQGRLAEAQLLLEKNLEVGKTMEPGSPALIETRVALVATLTYLGNLKAAEGHAIDVAQAMEEHGLDDRSRLRSKGDLTWIKANNEQLDEAEKMNKEILEQKIKLFGEDDGDTLTSYNTQAVLYHLTGRLPDAEKCAEIASNGRQKRLGRDHPDTLNALTNLAMIQASAGKLADAEKLTRYILKAREERLCFGHPATLATAGNLATILAEEGRQEEAATLRTHLEKRDLQSWAAYYAAKDAREGNAVETKTEASPPNLPTITRPVAYPLSSPSPSERQRILQSQQQQQQ